MRTGSANARPLLASREALLPVIGLVEPLGQLAEVQEPQHLLDPLVADCTDDPFFSHAVSAAIAGTSKSAISIALLG